MLASDNKSFDVNMPIILAGLTLPSTSGGTHKRNMMQGPAIQTSLTARSDRQCLICDLAARSRDWREIRLLVAYLSIKLIGSCIEYSTSPHSDIFSRGHNASPTLFRNKSTLFAEKYKMRRRENATFWLGRWRGRDVFSRGFALVSEA